MGLKHKTAAKATKLWAKTLRSFALTYGVITFDHIRNKLTEPVSKDDVKRLNKKLCDYFNISGNPIKHYKYAGKSEGYKTAFNIKDDTHLSKAKKDLQSDATNSDN